MAKAKSSGRGDFVGVMGYFRKGTVRKMRILKKVRFPNRDKQWRSEMLNEAMDLYLEKYLPEPAAVAP